MKKGAVVLAAAIAAGCGGGMPSAAPAATTAAVAASSPSPSASVASAPWPSGGPVPPELAGLWYLGTSVYMMRLSGNAYVLAGSSGNVVVTANEIVFFNDGRCGVPLPGGLGRYSWALTGSSVHFVRAADPCPRADLLSNATWSRTRS
jgi:hypothetical protein